ncbi:hypothetical protein N9L68_07015 [bacterium]|nr:hypothetical protein [bacterium]
MEPDQRHAYVTAREPQLTGSNGVTTPSEHNAREKEEDMKEELSPSEARRFLGNCGQS